MASSHYDARITALEAQYTEFRIQDNPRHGSEEGHDAKDQDMYDKRFIDILCDFTSILREAQAVGCTKEEFDPLVERIDAILNDAIEFAYDEEDGVYTDGEFLPSFAHAGGDEGVVKDVKQGGTFSRGYMSEIIPLVQKMIGVGKDISDFTKHFKPPPPWVETLRPHPTSTPCSRFRDVIPNWDPTFSTSHPRATAVFDAHCEISCDDICIPCNTILSPSNNILVTTGMGGYKNRVPYMHCFMIKDTSDTDQAGFVKPTTVKLDLTETVREVLIDEDRSLIFVGDEGRAKSYAWKKGKWNMSRVHTMATWSHAGPMALLSNGRFVRAGKGLSVGVWDIDSLETHGANGKKIIGGQPEELDTWRDDPEDIEPSRGIHPNRASNFEIENGRENEKKWMVYKWSKHPNLGDAGTMLCALGETRHAYYHCRAVDLEAGGKTVTRYLGHAGDINGFSTSTGVGGDPNIFLTSCGDRFARLYDVRQVLPVMTINSVASDEAADCSAAILAHPDGIPFIFTGSSEDEEVKVWDVRAKAIVYDLATGNNEVNSMVWDADENSLYVATTCQYVDRHGTHMGYRKAKLPKTKSGEGEEVEVDEDEDEDDDEDEEDEDDYEDYDTPCWPNRAYHAEDYYGHTFDAGGHRIYKFLFKMDADPQVVPYYGSATLDRGGSW